MNIRKFSHAAVEYFVMYHAQRSDVKWDPRRSSRFQESQEHSILVFRSNQGSIDRMMTD
jgi:hypothetical protein